MRRIREAVLPLAASDEHLPQTVREYRQKYKGVSQILDAHGEILEAGHEDLKKLSPGGRKGRRGAPHGSHPDAHRRRFRTGP